VGKNVKREYLILTGGWGRMLSVREGGEEC